MKEIFKTKEFWFTSMALAAMFFLIGINYNRAYIGEIEILVLPKSDMAVRNIDQIIGNVERVPFSLNFYGNLLQANRDVEDDIAELSDAKKKNALSSIYRVARVKNSSIVKIETTGSNYSQAEALAWSVAKQIAVSMSQYYSIRTDLEIRLLEEPIISAENRTADPKIIIPSLFFGFVFSVLFFMLKQMQSDNFAPTLKSIMREDENMHTNIPDAVPFEWAEPVQKETPLSSQPSVEQIVPAEKKEGLIMADAVESEIFFQQGLQKRKPTPSVEHSAVTDKTRKSSAPENLPVGSEFILNNLKLIKEKQEEARKHHFTESKDPGVPKNYEASEDEIKARLNKLLSGGK